MDLWIQVEDTPVSLPKFRISLLCPLIWDLLWCVWVISSPLDLFDGSGLSGFGLPVVGSALAAHSTGGSPAGHEELLWTLIDMGVYIPKGTT